MKKRLGGSGRAKAWGVLTWRGVSADKITAIRGIKKREWRLLDKADVHASITAGKHMPYPPLPAVEAAKAAYLTKKAAADAAAVSTAPTSTVQMA